MPSEVIHEPWRSFLHDLDNELAGPTEIHCFGGFVIAEYHELTRSTGDVDVIRALGTVGLGDLQRLAGRGSALAHRHRVYLDIVTIAAVPESYEDRLVDMFPGEFEKLRMRAFEAHDLALAKLARNEDVDREDLKRLALGPGLDVDVLTRRYHKELRFQLGRPEAGDLTLSLWIEIVKEVQKQS